MNAERWGDSAAHKIRRLRTGEGLLYRTIRLESLRESPEAFSSSYEVALGRDETSWMDQADAASEGADRAIFLALENEPVGLAGLYRDLENPSRGEMVQVWIAPSHRGSGAAQALLAHLFKWAAGHSYKAVIAEVPIANHRALRFYQKCGFTRHDGEGSGILLIREI
jgi:RimJ/RimL family protein N-acetyltransferase